MRESSRLNCLFSQDLRVILAPFGSDPLHVRILERCRERAEPRNGRFRLASQAPERQEPPHRRLW
jgi:hypothetical protein